MTNYEQTAIEADSDVPIFRITRDFAAPPAAVLRAHTDPELFARWIGPHGMPTKIDHWDARTGGSFRYLNIHEGEEYAFFGSFHEVTDTRIVQTFTWEGDPTGVALETLTFEDLGDGRTRLRTASLVGSFEERDAWLRSGMEVGINEGYEKLDRLIAEGGA